MDDRELLGRAAQTCQQEGQLKAAERGRGILQPDRSCVIAHSHDSVLSSVQFAELHVGATINLRGLAGKAASIHDSIYNHESTKVKFNLDVTQKRTAAAAAAAAAAAPAPSSGGFLPPLQLAAPHFAPMFAGAGTYVQPPPGWTVAMVPIESVAQCQRMW